MNTPYDTDGLNVLRSERGRLETTSALTPATQARPTRTPPSPWETAPQSISAAIRVRRFMASVGVSSISDVITLILSLVAACFVESNISFERSCVRLAPAMFAAFEDVSVARHSTESPEPGGFDVALADKAKILEKARQLEACLLIEADRMGFAPHIWAVGALWIIAALLVLELGHEQARLVFMVLIEL